MNYQRNIILSALTAFAFVSCEKKAAQSAAPAPAGTVAPAQTVLPYPVQSPSTNNAATPVATATVAAGTQPNATPVPTQYSMLKRPEFDGKQVKGSPLPELDATWKLKEVACLDGTLTPMAQDTTVKQLQSGQIERTLTIRGSVGTRSHKFTPDMTKKDAFCTAKGNFVVTFFPSDVEVRFDKTPWTVTGSTTGCATGELPAETWVATLYLTGTSGEVLVVVKDEKNSPEKYCTAGQAQLIYTK